MQVLNGHTFNVWIPVLEHDNLPNQSVSFYYKKLCVLWNRRRDNSGNCFRGTLSTTLLNKKSLVLQDIASIRADITLGLHVAIVLKKDQKTGNVTTGVVQRY